MVAGSFYYTEERKKRKKFEGVLAERKADEKRQAWIRELEARDAEDQEIRARREAARKRAAAAAAAEKARAATGAAVPTTQAVASTQEVEQKGQGVLKAVKELSGNG